MLSDGGGGGFEGASLTGRRGKVVPSNTFLFCFVGFVFFENVTA